MNLFKTKITRKDFAESLYQLGYSRYEFIKQQFNNVIKYNDNMLFLLIETITSTQVKRIFKYQNILDDFNIVDDVNKLVYLSFQNEEDKDNIISYFAYIKDELWEILDNDNEEMVHKLVNYFLNEITNGNIKVAIKENDIYEIKSHMINIFAQWHFELKTILQNYKIVEK